MTTIQTTVVGTTVTPANFLEAAAAGNVRFHTVRANGTTRRVQFYADGTEARETAEWVEEQRNDGRTMKDIAAEMHLSVPSVRRILNALALAQEVEDMEPEDIEAMLAEAQANADAEEGTEVATVAAVTADPTAEAQNAEPTAEATTEA